MTDNAEREQFEAYMETHGWRRELHMNRSLVNDSYAWATLNKAWGIWQAARGEPQSWRPDVAIAGQEVCTSCGSSRPSFGMAQRYKMSVRPIDSNGAQAEAIPDANGPWLLYSDLPKPTTTPAVEGLTFPQKEFDALLDHIYEHGTAAEGVKRRAEKMIEAALTTPAALPAQAMGEKRQVQSPGSTGTLLGDIAEHLRARNADKWRKSSDELLTRVEAAIALSAPQEASKGQLSDEEIDALISKHGYVGFEVDFKAIAKIVLAAAGGKK